MSFRLLKPGGAAIAVDFGTTALKLLQLGEGEELSLSAAAAIPTPPELRDKPAERLAFQADAIPRLLKEAPFRGRRVVCSIPAAQTLVHHVQVQRSDSVPLPKALADEIRQATGREPSTLILRHLEVGEVIRSGSKRSEMLCFAMPREVVLAFVRALREARIEPVGVHCEHLAGVRSLDRIQRRASDAEVTNLIVDLGGGTTKVMVSHGRDTVFAKTLHIGVHCLASAPGSVTAGRIVESRSSGVASSVTVAAAAAAGAARSEQAGESLLALEAERRNGLPPPGLSGVDVGRAAPSRPPVVEALIDEISICVRYYQAVFPDRPLTRLVFVGGGAADTNLCREVARGMRLPAQVADPLPALARASNVRAVGVDLSQPSPGWAVALGLCFSPKDL